MKLWHWCSWVSKSVWKMDTAGLVCPSVFRSLLRLWLKASKRSRRSRGEDTVLIQIHYYFLGSIQSFWNFGAGWVNIITSRGSRWESEPLQFTQTSSCVSGGLVLLRSLPSSLPRRSLVDMHSSGTRVDSLWTGSLLNADYRATNLNRSFKAPRCYVWKHSCRQELFTFVVFCLNGVVLADSCSVPCVCHWLLRVSGQPSASLLLQPSRGPVSQQRAGCVRHNDPFSPPWSSCFTRTCTFCCPSYRPAAHPDLCDLALHQNRFIVGVSDRLPHQQPSVYGLKLPQVRGVILGFLKMHKMFPAVRTSDSASTDMKQCCYELWNMSSCLVLMRIHMCGDDVCLSDLSRWSFLPLRLQEKLSLYFSLCSVFRKVVR